MMAMRGGMGKNVAAQVAKRAALRTRYFPETIIDDFSRIDNTIEFYTRVNALLSQDMTIVDLGAGRGQWYADATSTTRKTLRDLRGKVKHVIGVDVDPVVTQNPSLDEAHTIALDAQLPLDDGSVDIVISDFTFEHIENPTHFSAEIDRVLRPGGWVCARTPNKWGYIGIAARLAPNQFHAKLLRRLQPGHKEIDVFPTKYRLNTRRAVARYFPADRYDNIVYTAPCEPRYAGASRALWSLFQVGHRLEPRAFDPMLSIFLRKHA